GILPKAAGSSIQFCVALELVAGFVAVVDRLIKLLERKEAHQARLYDKFVDPLFRDLEPVAADYIKFFRETSELLDRALAEPDARSTMRAAAKRIRARPEEFLFARKKVQQLARVAVTQIKDEDVKGFAMSVAWFFSMPLRLGACGGPQIAPLRPWHPDDAASAR